MNDDSDFEIVIDDENIIPDFEALMPSVCEEIEEFDLEELTSRMIEKFECEVALLEEFENNLEKI